MSNDEMIILGVAGFFYIVKFTLYFLLLLSLHRALSQCHPDDRELEPSQIWFCLIPCFNLIWMFIVIDRLSTSLQNEFYARGLKPVGDLGRGSGTTYAIMKVISHVPYLGCLMEIGHIIFFFLYWVKISQINRILWQDSEMLLEEGYEGDYSDGDEYESYSEDESKPPTSQ